MDSLTDTLWDVGLSGLRGGFLPAKGPGLPVNGTSAGNSLPNKSTSTRMIHLSNEGVILQQNTQDP